MAQVDFQLLHFRRNSATIAPPLQTAPPATGAMASVEQIAAAFTSLEPTHSAITDVSGGCGAAFELVVVSAKFEGVKLLERHRMVHAALGDITKAVHALTAKTHTPAEWEAKQAKEAAAAAATGSA